MASGRSSGAGVELTMCAAEPLPEDFASREPAGRARALREAISRAGADFRSCVVVIPRSLAILRTFLLPSGSPEELHRMVQFQLEKELPLPLERVRTSYGVSAGPEGKTRITAVAVPKEALEDLIAPLEEAGCRVTGAVISSFGLLQLVPRDHPEGSVLVVVPEEDGAELVIARGGEMSLSRHAALRGAGLEELAVEIDRALTAHRAREADEVRRVLVAGHGESTERVVSGLKARLSREVEPLTLNGAVTCRPEANFSPEAAAPAGVCVGLLKARAHLPDLLNPPVVRRAFRPTRLHVFAALGAAALLVLVAASQWALAARRSELGTLRAQLRALEPSAERVGKTQLRLQTANQWMEERYAWIDLFDALRSKLDPREIFLTKVEAEENGLLRLWGKAKDDKAMTSYITELQKMTSVFHEVASEGIHQNSDPPGYKREFSMRIRIAGMLPREGKRPRARK